MNQRFMRYTLVCLALLLLVAPLTVHAEEPPKFGTGLIRSTGDFPRLDTSASIASLESLPSSVDLSAGLPPIGNQGTQSSCVGWALGYYYGTYYWGQELDWDVSQGSQQVSPAWVYNQRQTTDCSKDWGMTYVDGFSILMQKGAATAASFPYDQRDTCTQPSSDVLADAAQRKIPGFVNVFNQQGDADLTVLKSLLASGEPVAVGLPIYYPSFYAVTYADPVVERPSASDVEFGGHAMLLVGYDDAVGGFLAANSWGTNWGRDGYAYLSYDFMQQDVFEGWLIGTELPETSAQTLSLTEGWNLVSLPVVPDDGSVAALFASIEAQLDVAYVWDEYGETWQRYGPSLPSLSNSLKHVDETMGVWLHMNSDADLVVSGEARTEPKVALTPGWNLVAYPGTNEKTAEEALASIDGLYVATVGFDSGTTLGGWEAYTPEGESTLSTFKPGRGYWIEVTESCDWVVAD